MELKIISEFLPLLFCNDELELTMSWDYLFVETKINWFTQLCQQQLSKVKDKFQNNFKLETFKSKSIDEIKDRFNAKPFENFPNFLIYFSLKSLILKTC